MACFVPFNSRNLEISFFVFRPTVVVVDELIEMLKHFSSCSHTLGCVQSCVFKSIHGNMIIWYGAWMKKSSQNKELLSAALLSMLSNTSSIASLLEYCFFDAYAGESRDGSFATKFSTGDAISMNSMASESGDINDLSYANLELFKSRFQKMEGSTSGVCLKSQHLLRVACLCVWKSLHHFYSWILNSDNRALALPYLDRFPLNIKYDIFRVVCVNGDNNVLSHQHIPLNPMLENGGENEEKGQVVVRQ